AVTITHYARNDGVDGRVHGWIVKRTIAFEDALQTDGIGKRGRAERISHPEAHRLHDLEREKAAVHPSAETDSLGGKKNVLADGRRFAEHEVAGLALQDRQRQDFALVDQATV